MYLIASHFALNIKGGHHCPRGGGHYCPRGGGQKRLSIHSPAHSASKLKLSPDARSRDRKLPLADIRPHGRALHSWQLIFIRRLRPRQVTHRLVPHHEALRLERRHRAPHSPPYILATDQRVPADLLERSEGAAHLRIPRQRDRPQHELLPVTERSSSIRRAQVLHVTQ